MKGVKIVLEIDANELAVIIAESTTGNQRPKNTSAEEALTYFDEETKIRLILAAANATHYILGKVGEAQRLQ